MSGALLLAQLNTALAERDNARTALVHVEAERRALREECDQLSAKVVGLQSHLGRAEALFRVVHTQRDQARQHLRYLVEQAKLFGMADEGNNAYLKAVVYLEGEQA